MYKITLHFDSHIKGVFSQEVQTAPNAMLLMKIQRRMLLKWVKILMPKISINKIKYLPEFILEGMIHQKVDILNEIHPGEQNRSFKIKYEPETTFEVLEKINKELSDNLYERLTTNIYEYLSEDYDGDSEK